MALTAFKQPRDLFSLSLIFTPTIENFFTVFQPPWNLGRRMLNSVVIAVATVSIAIPVSVLAAYAFSRFDFMFKRGLFS